jgi:hypothetical protein
MSLAVAEEGDQELILEGDQERVLLVLVQVFQERA